MPEIQPRTKGSVTNASCRVSLLQSADMPVTIAKPWYLEMLRAYEMHEMELQRQKKQQVQ